MSMRMDLKEIDKAPFWELDTTTLYGILKLRSEVFVVEQNCVYQDLDDIDQLSWHLWMKANGRVIACVRVFMKDPERKTVQIGRVVVAAEKRRKGIASALMKEAMLLARTELGARQLYLEAQTYAIPFYQQMGFRVCSEEFLEDGIPHVGMNFEVES